MGNIDDFLSLPLCILHCLICSAAFALHAADHQIGAVYHLTISDLDSGFEMLVCRSSADFDIIIIAFKGILIV